MSNETIVVVEDNDAVREVTARILLRGGYAVLEAAAPSEAIEIFRTFPYPIHLVLTDMVMPRMSGIELVHHLREMRPEVALLFMSGYRWDAVVSAPGCARPVPVLAKPFRADGLLRAVREALDPGADRSLCPG